MSEIIPVAADASYRNAKRYLKMVNAVLLANGVSTETIKDKDVYEHSESNVRYYNDVLKIVYDEKTPGNGAFVGIFDDDDPNRDLIGITQLASFEKSDLKHYEDPSRYTRDRLKVNRNLFNGNPLGMRSLYAQPGSEQGNILEELIHHAIKQADLNQQTQIYAPFAPFDQGKEVAMANGFVSTDRQMQRFGLPYTLFVRDTD